MLSARCGLQPNSFRRKYWIVEGQPAASGVARPVEWLSQRAARTRSRSQLPAELPAGWVSALTSAILNARRNCPVGSRRSGNPERSASLSTIRVCGGYLRVRNGPLVSARGAEGPTSVSPARSGRVPSVRRPGAGARSRGPWPCGRARGGWPRQVGGRARSAPA